jgi:hypothetical protein
MPKTNMLKFDAASVAGEKQVRLVLTPRMDDGVIGMSGTIAYLLFTNGFNFIAADSTDGGAYKECERISHSNTRREGQGGP